MRIRLKRQRLIEELKKRSISQNAWARRLGVSPAYLSMMIRGERPYPGQAVRQRLMDRLGLPFEALFEIEQSDRPTSSPVTQGRRNILEWNLGRLRLRLDQRPKSQAGGRALLRNDLRFALRQLSKNWVFSAVVIATLALTVGASSAVFSVVNSILLRDLAFPQPHRLVTLWESYDGGAVSPRNYLDWKAQSRSFQHMAAFAGLTLNLSLPESPERVPALAVTSDFLPTLGFLPAAGRNFLPEDEEGDGQVIILTHQLWASRFGSDPSLLNRTIRVGGRDVRVTGILPPGFEFPYDDGENPVALMPLILTPEQRSESQRGAHWIGVIGRLAPDVPLAQARAEMTSLMKRIQEEHEHDENHVSVLTSLHEHHVGDVRSKLLLLLLAVAAVLAIAAVNIASLYAVRAGTRRSEFALRTALGASRGRLASQLLAEGLVISVAGAALGCLLAYLTLDRLVALFPGGMPRLQAVSLDWTVLAFAFLLALILGTVFGLVPLLRKRDDDLISALNSRSRSGGGLRKWVGGALIAAESGLALALLIVAGLSALSYLQLERVELGYQRAAAHTFRVSIPASYETSDDVARLVRTLRQRLEALPGVEHAGAAMMLPMGSEGDSGGTFSIEGFPRDQGLEAPRARLRPITPGFLRSMGIALQQGRDFSASDRKDSPTVYLVNRKLADTYWPGQEPLGKRIRPHVGLAGRGQWGQVVGVISDVNYYGPELTPRPEIFLAHAQTPVDEVSFVVKASSPAAAAELPREIRSVVAELDPDLPIFKVRTLDEHHRWALSPHHFRSWMMGAFALAAIALALLGTYGVLSHYVGQRIHEIGVRIALGARSPDLMRQVAGHGIAWTLAGIALGALGAEALIRLISGLLIQVEPLKWQTCAIMGLLFLISAAAAGCLPVRRALRIDPVTALRQD